jgi:hypothetical protein
MAYATLHKPYTNLDQSSSEELHALLENSDRPRNQLTAKWIIENEKLVCQWHLSPR